jgi:hypothetical protein
MLYGEKPATMQELRHGIEESCAGIPAETQCEFLALVFASINCVQMLHVGNPNFCNSEPYDTNYYLPIYHLSYFFILFNIIFFLC